MIWRIDKRCSAAHYSGRHTITQPSRHVQADCIINGFAGSAQTRQSSTDGPGGSTFLSDRLLEVLPSLRQTPLIHLIDLVREIIELF